ncbi:MAG: hypothetical protein JXQ27_03755 [Acidobacteria bacterium]|nr:hypothetical protein [Acidobacteriota bacterium]
MTRLNYFNYYTEIEEFFIQKRGKHILLSPLDWMLIETWREMEIPLTVVLRGIDRAVALFQEKESRYRFVNSLYYCNQAVLEEQEKYLLSKTGGAAGVGAGDAESEGAAVADDTAAVQMEEHVRSFRQALLAFVESQPTERVRETADRLEKRLEEILAAHQSGCDAEGLERYLMILNDLLNPCLEECLTPEEKKELLRECRAELRHHRRNLPPEMYERILRNLYLKKLKEHFRIPDLSLLNIP